MSRRPPPRIITAVTEDLQVHRISEDVLRFIQQMEGGPRRRVPWRAWFRTQWRYLRQMGYNPWNPLDWRRCNRAEETDNLYLAEDPVLARDLGIHRLSEPAEPGEGLRMVPDPYWNRLPGESWEAFPPLPGRPAPAPGDRAPMLLGDLAPLLKSNDPEVRQQVQKVLGPASEATPPSSGSAKRPPRRR